MNTRHLAAIWQAITTWVANQWIYNWVLPARVKNLLQEHPKWGVPANLLVKVMHNQINGSNGELISARIQKMAAEGEIISKENSSSAEVVYFPQI
uniref:Uncharacterized protein n=1 Tax=candidate division WWE3 bacterium TaxID=2053526 RepID=A0A7C4XN99_UNCKA